MLKYTYKTWIIFRSWCTNDFTNYQSNWNVLGNVRRFVIHNQWINATLSNKFFLRMFIANKYCNCNFKEYIHRHNAIQTLRQWNEPAGHPSNWNILGSVRRVIENSYVGNSFELYQTLASLWRLLFSFLFFSRRLSNKRNFPYFKAIYHKLITRIL